MTYTILGSQYPAESSSNPATSVFTTGATSTLLTLGITTTGTARSTGSPTWNGSTFLMAAPRAAAAEGYSELFYILNPSRSVAGSVSIPNTGTTGIQWMVADFNASVGSSNFHLGSSCGSTGGANPSMTLTTQFTSMFVQSFFTGNTAPPTAYSGTKLGSTDTGNEANAHQWYTQASAGARAGSFTVVADDWALVTGAFSEFLMYEKTITGYSSIVVLSTLTNTIDSKSIVKQPNITQTIDSKSIVKWLSVEKTITGNSFVKKTVSQTIDSKTVIKSFDVTKVIDSKQHVKLLGGTEQGLTLQDSYDTSNQNTYSYIYSGANIAWGQVFYVPNGGVLDSCKFYLKKGGSPPGSMYAKIWAVTGTPGTNGKPTGTVLATSNAVSTETVTTSFALVSFQFSGDNRITLNSETWYALEFYYNDGDASNRIWIGYDSTSSTHNGNSFRASVEPTWDTTLAANDTVFFVYTGSSTPANTYTIIGNSHFKTASNAQQITGKSYTKRTVTVGTGGAWYNPSWQYRVKLTIQASKVDADLTDFPVYVDLSNLPAHFHSNVKTDGADIRITKSDGQTELAREVVFYNSSTDTGELHFKYEGTLSGTVNTDIYIYYGNNGASDYATTDQYGSENVWKSEYKGVWHFPNGTTLTSLDSTANSNDGTASNVAASSGKITGGFTASTGAGKVDFGTSNTLNVTGASGGASFDFWVKRNGDSLSGTYNGFITRLTSDVLNGYQIYSLNSDNGLGYYEGSTFASGYTFTDTNWHHIVITDDGTYIRFYVDGNIVGDPQLGTTTGTTSATHHQFSGYNGLNGINGELDEIRIIGQALTDTWISTEYNNQNSPSTFYNLSDIEYLGIQSNSKIKRTETQIIYGYSSITLPLNTITNIIYSKSWLKQNLIQTVTGKSIVKQLATTKTIDSKAIVKIFAVTKTLDSKSIIKVFDVTKTIDSKSIVKKFDVTKTIDSKSVVVNTLSNIIYSKSWIKQVVSQSITSKSITKQTPSTTITGQSWIKRQRFAGKDKYTTNLVARWNLNETLTDDVNGKVLTATPSAQWADTITGRGVYLGSPVGSYLSRTDSAFALGSFTWTYAYRRLPGSPTTQWPSVLSINNDSHKYPAFNFPNWGTTCNFETGSPIAGVWDGTKWTNQALGNSPLGSWNFKAVSYPTDSGSSAMTYWGYNGSSLGSNGPGTHYVNPSGSTFYINNNSSPEVIVDEVRIYNRSLSTLEITEIYDAYSKTLTSKSLIKNTLTSTITGNSHIKTSVSNILYGKSWIKPTVSQTIYSNSIVKVFDATKTITGYSFLSTTPTKSISSNSIVKVFDVSKTIYSKVFVSGTRTNIIYSGCVIKSTITPIIYSKSIVKALSVSKVITGNSNVFVGGQTSITGYSRIKTTSPALIYSNSFVSILTSNVIYSKVHILTPNINIITSKSIVKRFSIEKTIYSQSNVTGGGSSTISGKSHIKNTYSIQRTGYSSLIVLSTTTKTIYAKSIIKVFGIGKTIYSSSSISQSVNKYISSRSVVVNNISQNIYGKVIVKDTYSKYISTYAHIWTGAEPKKPKIHSSNHGKPTQPISVVDVLKKPFTFISKKKPYDNTVSVQKTRPNKPVLLDKENR